MIREAIDQRRHSVLRGEANIVHAVLKTEDFVKCSADPFNEFAFSCTRQTLNHMTKRFCIGHVDAVAANLTCFKPTAIQNYAQNLELLFTKKVR